MSFDLLEKKTLHLQLTMPENKNIYNHLRHLLLSFTLLWALVLNGQEVVAYRAPAKAPVKTTQLATAPDGDCKTVVKKKVSLEATTSCVLLNLQQAIVPAPFQSFARPANDDLPAAVISSAGAGFMAQLFPVTIQPNAP